MDVNEKNKTYIGLDVGSIAVKAVVINESLEIVYKTYERTLGRPVNVVSDILSKIKKNNLKAERIVATGSGADLVRDLVSNIEFQTINEFKAIVTAVNRFYPDVRTIFEMGGESSKFIRIDDGQIVEYGINGDCAAGTGSFIDQQAERLHYKVEEIGPLVSCSGRCANIAGRCSVFAKSDMIHAQQKGYTPPEVLKGLCLAVARNFKATIVKGRHVEPRIAFVGGLALNEGVVSSLSEVFELKDGQLIVPADAEYFGAIGAAMTASECHSEGVERPKNLLYSTVSMGSFTSVQDDRITSLPPLSTQNVRFLRDKVRPYKIPPNPPFLKGEEEGLIDVYLGIDIGSVSTNFVVLDGHGDMIMEIYTYTKARPIEVVSEGLKEIKVTIGDRINVCGVGTTGSGRELIGELIGADVVKDEITAHKTGALHICERLVGDKTDTIFEIGGQDAKYIRIENGVVTDFAMNEACAAGTGSFLEEQANRLGINIKEEFARLALSSRNPLPLGERCTVFMERDVNSHQLRSADVKDIVAGLAYSVATNYLNRVVRGRHIGEHIFFQGGTAYNDAVAAAFSQILGRTITVPPHNGVIGAIGAALLASQTGDKRTTKFRGFDLGKVNYTMREFQCSACTNTCDIQEFNVEGEKTYWGDKCSSRFRKKARTDNKPIIEDLFRLRGKLLTDFTNIQTHEHTNIRIGIPRAMFYFDRFPFWNAYFESLGCKVVVSDPTNKEISHNSLEMSVSEPCYPIKLVNGHVRDLFKKGVDYVFLPNVISSEALPNNDKIPYLCPWHQTVPFVVRTVPAFADTKFLIPTIQFELGQDFVGNCLKNVAKELKRSSRENKTAVKAAYKAQKAFSLKLQELGRDVLQRLDSSGFHAVVLVGRPYNIYDTGANLNVPAKLRDYYGLNVIPFDFLPVDDVDISDVAGNMFWNYGRKIIAAAKIVASRPNLHMIYITNFKCGPDSFIKHFSAWGSKNKPYLTLQFDEHANDAGVITRIEAYLDSKGLLKTNAICNNLESAHYSSRKWITVVQESSQLPSAHAE